MLDLSDLNRSKQRREGSAMIISCWVVLCFVCCTHLLAYLCASHSSTCWLCIRAICVVGYGIDCVLAFLLLLLLLLLLCVCVCVCFWLCISLSHTQTWHFGKQYRLRQKLLNIGEGLPNSFGWTSPSLLVASIMKMAVFLPSNHSSKVTTLLPQLLSKSVL